MAATVAASESRIEIVGERRRAYDPDFRAQLVEASFAPGVQVRDLARRHGVCVSLIYRWRRSMPPMVMPATDVRRGAARRTVSSKTAVAATALEFVPIGVFGRAEDEGPALVAAPSAALAQRPSPGGEASPRPGLDERPGVIEIDLSDGTRLRVDAFVNERALRRVMAVLRTAS